MAMNKVRLPRSRTRLLAFAVAACFANAAAALPSAPQVVAGAATINQAGNLLTVNNAANTAINWQQFSIAANERVRFNQPSASSYVVNRVLSNDPSVLLGQLSSNGAVWLINRAGILVGQGAQIDVARFVASTLNISNDNILAGKLNFEQTLGAGSVINQGSIATPTGGSVYLIAPNVSNEGIITTPQGETILAAGQTVQLLDTATPGVTVEITGATGNVTNLGSIVSEAGRIGMAGVLVRNSGALNASSVVNEGGRIFLKASQDAYVDQAGRIVTTGAKGGSVEVLGQRVAVMDRAQIDASGQNGGGSILIGGDYQGRNAAVQNSTMAYFGPDAVLKADAIEQGKGGKVILWADDTTRAYGSIFARAGRTGGDGGFVETSGKRYLDANGVRVQVAAPSGAAGTWLLDPSDLTITSSMYGGTDQYLVGAPSGPFSASYGAATITDSTLNYALSYGGNVAVTTSSVYGGLGDISFLPNAYGAMPSITATGNVVTTLTLNADRNINLQGTFTNAATNTGATFAVQLNAGMTNTAGKINVGAGQSLNLNGGSEGVELQVMNGKVWDNLGTVNMTQAQIRLDDGGNFATFNNTNTGVLSINSNSGGYPIFGGIGGVVDNAGVIDVNDYTTFAGVFNNAPTGVVNLNGQTLTLRNAGNIAGEINTGENGWLTILGDSDGAQFTGTAFNGAGVVQLMEYGGSPTVASFTNVDAKEVSLYVEYGGTANINGGLTTLGAVNLNSASSYIGLNNGALGVYGGDLVVPTTNVSYTGDVGYLTTGNLLLSSISLNAPANLLLVSGWDGVSPLATPQVTAGIGKDIVANGAQIHANGAMSLIAGNDIVIASAHINSNAAMQLLAENHIHAYGGGVTGSGVNIHAGGDQVIKAGNEIWFEGGTANDPNPGYGAAINVSTYGKQQLEANYIKLHAGISGHDNGVWVKAGDAQTVTVSGTAGLLELKGGGDANDSYRNRAEIFHDGLGHQLITVYGGGSVSLVGGSGSGASSAYGSECVALGFSLNACAGNKNGAEIFNKTGAQTIDFTDNGVLTLTGGSDGSDNYVEIVNASSAPQTINGAPDITLTGGSSGGSFVGMMNGVAHTMANDAGIYTDYGAQVINAGSIYVDGGSAAYGGAGLGAPLQTISTTGDLTLSGGSTPIFDPLVPTTPVYIGNMDVTNLTLNVGGSLNAFQGDSDVMIGSFLGKGGVLAANVGGSIWLGDKTRLGNFSGVALAPMHITLHAQGDVYLGTMFADAYGGNIDIRAGLGGTGSLSMSGANFRTLGAGTVNVFAQNDLSITATSMLGSGFVINGNGTMNVAADNIALSANYGGMAYLRSDGSGTQTVSATNSLMLSGAGAWDDTLTHPFYGGSALISAGSVAAPAIQNINAGTINLLAGGHLDFIGNLTQNHAAIEVAGVQHINASGAITLIGGDLGQDNVARLSSSGNQTLTAGALMLSAGIEGQGNRAMVEAHGIQQVTLTDSGTALHLSGGGSTANDYGNSAELAQRSATGQQTVTLSGSGASVSLVGGAGAGMNPFGYDNDCGLACQGLSSWNSAVIVNQGGSQTLNFTQPGGSLGLVAGSNGNNNSARIENRSAGPQQILGDPAILLANGSSGGMALWSASLIDKPGYAVWHYLSNDASIDADGSQTINASSLALNANNGASYGGAFVSGQTQLINVTGAASLSSGSVAINANPANADEPLFTEMAVIGGDKPGHQLTLNAGALDLNGGSIGSYGGAISAIGSYLSATNTEINSSGAITANGGNAGSIRLGALYGSGGTLRITADGNISLGNALVGTDKSGMVELTSTGGGISQSMDGSIGTDQLVLSAVAGGIDLPGVNLAPQVLASSATGLIYSTDAPNTAISADVTMGSIIVQNDLTRPGGGSIALGALNASGDVTVIARDAILEAAPGTGIEITASTANLSSVQGGASGGLAISADTAITGSLTANVQSGATYGGIRIENTGSDLTGVTLTDNALSDGLISFNNIGSSNTAFNAAIAYGGDIAIHADGDLVLNGGNLSTGSGSVLIGASGNLDVPNPLMAGANNDLALVAGNVLTIGSGVSTSGSGTIVLAASSVDVNGGSASAGGDIGLLADSVNLAAGSSLYAQNDVIFDTGDFLATSSSVHAGHDVLGSVAQNLRLNHGSSLSAGNSVYLTFTGPASMLYINETAGMAASYVHAVNPNTIHLAFESNPSDGVVIDGVTTATTTGSSGLFVGAPMVAAAPGAGLDLVYSLAADPLVQNVIIQTIVTSTATAESGEATNAESSSTDPGLLASTTTGTTTFTSPTTETTGGTTGTFGADNGTGATTTTGTTGDSAAGSTTTTDTTSSTTSGEQTSASTDGTTQTEDTKKDDKKDDKNAKKQNDDSSDGKKQDGKSSGKKMALCS